MEGRDHVSLLHGDTPGTLKEPGSNHSKDKPTDVCQVRYATSLHSCHRTSIQEL